MKFPTSLFNNDIATIVSIIPFEVRETKPGLTPSYFNIKASENEEPSILYIKGCYHFLYVDETRGSIRIPDSAHEVARSIVHDYITSQLSITDTAYPGIFWLPGEIPANMIPTDQLEEASKNQYNWFVNICKLADDDWSRYQKHTVISDFQRKAARIIGWEAKEHEWMDKVTAFNSAHCPACYSALLHPKAAICAVCRTNVLTFNKEMING